MTCACGRHRRVHVPRTVITGDVQTAPCPNPACRSFDTFAHLFRGDVLFRGCKTCGHVWDDVRHIPVKVRG